MRSQAQDDMGVGVRVRTTPYLKFPRVPCRINCIVLLYLS